LTSQQLKELFELGDRSRSSVLCEDHAALAERTVNQLDESIQHVEQTLRSLGLLMEDRTLPKALVGAMGISAVELRSQLPALREAVKDAAKEAGK
jgi:hypothetical protein